MTDEIENPLLSIKRAVDAFTGFFVICFILVNILVLIFGTSEFFSRLGSLWVALLLLFFGALRSIINSTRSAIEGNGPFAEMAKKRLEPITFDDDKGWLNFMSEDGFEYERPLPKPHEIRVLFVDFEQRVLASAVPNELMIGFLATLQWGFGDLFHCWINANGCTT